MRTELELALFKGFYNSNIDSYVDDVVSNDLSEMGVEYDDCDIEYDYNELAKDIFDFAHYELFSEFQFLSKLEFSELVSPKYYNYSNDKIYFNCDIDKGQFIDWLIDLVDSGGEVWDMVCREIIDQHTSCSGFHSFHSNKTKDWIKDLIEFDLDNSKTVYKLGFILSEYIKADKFLDDHNWNFENKYTTNGSYSAVYTCYSIKQNN